MDRGEALLQGLRRQLEHRLDSIRRSVGATTVSIVPQPDGEFSIRVEWVMKDGTKTFDHSFTQRSVFGASYMGSPMAWRVEKKACDYARDCIRQVLAARGV
jgi:3-phenylpropionate/cinnamic acid dioxygenase small subunit